MGMRNGVSHLVQAFCPKSCRCHLRSHPLFAPSLDQMSPYPPPLPERSSAVDGILAAFGRMPRPGKDYAHCTVPRGKMNLQSPCQWTEPLEFASRI